MKFKISGMVGYASLWGHAGNLHDKLFDNIYRVILTQLEIMKQNCNEGRGETH